MTSMRWVSVAGLCCLAFLVTGCGGGGGGSSGFSIGGTVQGLTGGTVVLQNNGKDDLSRSADGAFKFATELSNGSAYAVTVRTQPANQFCAVVNPSGTVSSENVENVRVNCVPAYTVGGSVTGLADGGTLVLHNNGADDLSVSANGPFTFATGLVNNSAYAVTVHSQPAGQVCSVTNGSGTVSAANVTNVAVTCEEAYTIGGNVSGLTGGALVLQNNGADDLTLSADGPFAFATPMASNSLYAVTVKTQPADLVCEVTGGDGTVGAANVTGVAVSCAPLDTPAALSLTYGIKQLKFTWAAVDGATFYRLSENPDGASGYTQIGADIATTSYDHGIFLPRRLGARYILSACNDVGCKDSNPVSVSSTLVEAIGYVKASNTGVGDTFGQAIALSADGATLAVGAMLEDSAATGIDGNQADNTATSAGAVYVFAYDGTDWTQQAYLKASNASALDGFGNDVALSFDGNTLAVAATGEDSAATGIGGDQADNSVLGSGAVYIFTRSGGVWTQQAYLKASNTGAGDTFGFAVSLSADGNTLAVGATGEDSAGGGEADDCAEPTPANCAQDSGAVYVFTRSGVDWAQLAYIKAPNAGAGDVFGNGVALSADGTTLAMAAYLEDSGATGIDGNPVDDCGADTPVNCAQDSGAVYVFIRSGADWTQQAYVKASNAGVGDWFGVAIALSNDGATLAVGAMHEDGAGPGLDGDPANNGTPDSGAAYVFAHNGIAWSQQAYVKASNTRTLDEFGRSVALSGDGGTLAVGAWAEDGGSTGLNGNQASTGGFDSGAVYLYRRSAEVWSPAVVYIKASNTGPSDFFGQRVALSADGATLAAGAFVEDSAATGIGGDQASNALSSAGAVYLY